MVFNKILDPVAWMLNGCTVYFAEMSEHCLYFSNEVKSQNAT